jgi:hypothetical protein
MNRPHRGVRRTFRLWGLALVAFVLGVQAAGADPGDAAAGQDTYKAMKKGAEALQGAKQSLENAKVGKTHRDDALKKVTEALTELDKGVAYADKNMGPGEKTKSFFEPDRGKLSSTQRKYKAISNAATKVIDAGKALDNGFDKFGGHRVKAIKRLNEALDDLEKAVMDPD